MTYNESKAQLDEIRCQNEMIFRMAISHLMDVGIRHLDDQTVERTCSKIMQEDDSRAFMSNAFQCDLVRTAAKLAKFDHIHLLVYISQNIEYDV